MIKKYIPLIMILTASIILSCDTYEKKYDGPHTLIESGIKTENKIESNDQETGDSIADHGVVAGTILSINYNKNEILVNQKKVIELGSVVYVIIEDKEILMTVIFPMMTSFKCIVVPNQMQYFKKIKKGMTVYLKE